MVIVNIVTATTTNTAIPPNAFNAFDWNNAPNVSYGGRMTASGYQLMYD